MTQAQVLREHYNRIFSTPELANYVHQNYEVDVDDFLPWADKSENTPAMLQMLKFIPEKRITVKADALFKIFLSRGINALVEYMLDSYNLKPAVQLFIHTQVPSTVDLFRKLYPDTDETNELYLWLIAKRKGIVCTIHRVFTFLSRLQSIASSIVIQLQSILLCP